MVWQQKILFFVASLFWLLVFLAFFLHNCFQYPHFFSMSYRQLIQEAWAFTQNNKKLVIWYGFLPAIFTTTVGVIYLTYQFFAFKKSYLFDNAQQSFLSDVFHFATVFIKAHLNFTLPVIIFCAIFLVIYLLFPTAAQAAAIQYIARKKNGQEMSVGGSMRHGILRFLPLFEYHLMIKTFGIFTLLFEAGFVLRNLGMDLFQIMLPLFIIIFIFGIILTLLFTYADFFIVIDREPIITSIKKSMKLVIYHWQKTFFVSLLMIIIGVRIILQVFLLLLIPSMLIFVGGYVATFALAKIGIIIGGILSISALLFASYLTGAVDVFSYVVWTFTFLDLTSQKELSAREPEDVSASN